VGQIRVPKSSAEDPKTKVDLWVVSVEGNRKPIPLLREDYSEYDGRLRGSQGRFHIYELRVTGPRAWHCYHPMIKPLDFSKNHQGWNIFAPAVIWIRKVSLDNGCKSM